MQFLFWSTLWRLMLFLHSQDNQAKFSHFIPTTIFSTANVMKQSPLNRRMATIMQSLLSLKKFYTLSTKCKTICMLPIIISINIFTSLYQIYLFALLMEAHFALYEEENSILHSVQVKSLLLKLLWCRNWPGAVMWI